MSRTGRSWRGSCRQTPNAQGAQAAPEVGVDPLWLGAQQLLRDAGRMEGPQLLAELQALSGSAQAAKRLLVRLRHNAQVSVKSAADSPIYSWVGEAD